MTEPVLILAWLLLAHLIADFVLQNDWIAMNKGNGGREGWSALLVHGGHVALCLVPVALAFGLRGLAYLALVAGSHMLVDRWKTAATRRADASAQEAARRRLEAGDTTVSGLGAAWSPIPAVLFLADQLFHVLLAVGGWLILLEGEPLTVAFVDGVNAVLRGWDRDTVHATVLTAVVLVSLLIVNTRGAYYFVLSLVLPRELAGPPSSAARPPLTQGYTVRMGPLVATVEPVAGSAGPGAGAAGGDTRSVPPGEVPANPPDGTRGDVAAAGRPRTRPLPFGAPMRIGATIGALERLLVVAFVLVRAEAAIGLVVAAKTLARFRQLDDRGFAEYYLLGTLASISVAIATGLLAAAALGTLG